MICSLSPRGGDGAAAFENPDTEEAVEIIFEAGADESVTHVSERLDGRGVGCRRWVAVDEVALQSDVLLEQISPDVASLLSC